MGNDVQRIRTTMKENTKVLDRIISIISVVLTLMIGIFTLVVNVNLHKRNEAWEERAKKDLAIPIFRIVKANEDSTKMEVYLPDRELSVIDGARERHFSIRGFAFENMTDNIATFNHIEYGNKAFELKNTQLMAQKNEIISFSENNLFIGTEYENEFYIIIKTRYQEYYSYKCTLYSETMAGEIACYSAASIDMPIPYDINNDVYQNRYIPVRDITINPPGGIIF